MASLYIDVSSLHGSGPRSSARLLCAASFSLVVGCLAEGSGSPDGTVGQDGDGSGLDGAALYVSKGCVNCHGPLATSQKRNVTLARIRAAAGPDSQIVPMQNIELTDDEINALVTALADPRIPGAADRRVPLIKPLLLTREEVASRLLSIFRPVGTDTNEEEVLERISRYINEQPSFFGGHCGLYDRCGIAELNASQNPATSTVRAGLLLRTCADLLAMPNMETGVLAKVQLAPNDAADASNVRALWDLFAPGRSLSNETVNHVVNAAQADPSQSWSIVMQLFCRPTVLETI